jgi:hypothetical protein
MLFGALGQSITMVLLTITAYLATPLDALPFPGQANNRAGIGAVALFFVFNSIFAIGWLGSPWLVSHTPLDNGILCLHSHQAIPPIINVCREFFPVPK